MAAITEDKAEYTQVVPIEQYEPSMLRALFDRQAAGMVPVDIHIEAQGAEQRYSTQGLTAFRDAAAAWPWDTLLLRLGLLCGEIQNNPLLIGESLRVFAEDRVFWDETAGQWRFLLLATEGAAWAGLSDHRPQALWQALLLAAQEANPQAASLLGQAIGFTGQGAFSISSLRQLLSDLAEEQPPEPAPESESAPASEPEPENPSARRRTPGSRSLSPQRRPSRRRRHPSPQRRRRRPQRRTRGIWPCPLTSCSTKRAFSPRRSWKCRFQRNPRLSRRMARSPAPFPPI
ncbi:MAG: hypothetical protein LUG57_02855 [Oscillospiraceae bacterium]|nr:hypothetical protein [Oscillospiraceae bacterium]